MNSSIFNFKENTVDIKGFASAQNLIFFLFFILYIYLTVDVINSGFLGYRKGIIGGMLFLIFIFKKRYRLVFAVIISSIVVFLIIGELYFRLNYFGMDGIKYFNKYVSAGIGDPLSTLDYDDNTYTGLKIKSRSIFKGGIFETNNLGFRDNDRYYKKCGDTIRIVICGTSISMGAGVDQGKNYSAYLEKMLNDGNEIKKFEVINLSVGGYKMSDMVDVLLRYGMKFDPDIVLIEDNNWNSVKLHPKKEFKGSKKQLFKMALKKPHHILFFFKAIKSEYISNFIKFIKKSVVEERVYSRLMNAKNKLMGIDREVGKETEREGKKEQMEKKMKRYYLGKIKNIARGKTVYIVSFRPMRHLHKDAKAKGEIKELCSEFGFEHIDTYKENFGSNDREMIIYIGDRHPNAKAHRIYANAILNAMKQDVEYGLWENEDSGRRYGFYK